MDTGNVVAEAVKSEGVWAVSLGVIAVLVALAIIILILILILKKNNALPKWFNNGNKKGVPRSCHLGCPLVSDIPVLIEETKRHTEEYLSKYLFDRVAASSAYSRRRIDYLRNNFLGAISSRLYRDYPAEHDEDMRIIRIFSHYLFNFIFDEVKDSLMRNSFPEDDNDWKEYKRVQVDFIISEACRRTANIYPAKLSLSNQEFWDVVDNINYRSVLSEEIISIFDFARRDFAKLAHEAENDNEKFTSRVLSILEGELHTAPFGGGNVSE
ncbi:MAG: hypothetical protein SVK08_00350 [Halobacteriota archaeon]|nr:hypothetical protein [Halobacteriota archaeon]